MKIEVHPVQNISGTLQVPGDKSISHRAAILGALSYGTTEITGFSPGLDCASTLSCLEGLGVQIDRSDQGNVIVKGNGHESLTEPEDILDAGNSGTTMRLLSGVLASLPFCSVITGDRSLRKRPMDRITIPLREMGARIYGRQGRRFAPLTIEGGNIQGISYHSKVASAQVKSCILLAGLGASGKTHVEEPTQSRDHTERMLRYFGAGISTDGLVTTITGDSKLSAKQVHVPGDISSAAYFIALAAIIPGSELVIDNTGINPTRTGFLDVIQRMGGHISFENLTEHALEPVASIRVRGAKLNAVKVGPHDIPGLIDEIPVLSVLATQAHGLTEISGAQELRVKESDRLSAITQELRKMGADITEKEDGLLIKGPTPLNNAHVESYGDHRIAMALAVAGCLASGITIINGAGCANISYPGFWDSLRNLTWGRSE